jgi:hypothetical protein
MELTLLSGIVTYMPSRPGIRRHAPSRWSTLAVTTAAGSVVVSTVLSLLGLMPSTGTHAAEGRAWSEPTRAVSAVPGAQPADDGLQVAAQREPPAAPDQRVVVFGQWRYPDLIGPVLGTVGPLLRYRVAVEQGLPVTVSEFTDVVDTTLADPRSWIAGRDVRLQRVLAPSVYDFTVFLASPSTAYNLCLEGGVDIRTNAVPYTSCRAGDKVVINASRYLEGVPDYGAPLADYRRYVVNHEVGHRLGHGHVGCPGAGQPAPVMQQQTLGLRGCVANSWPYVNGQRYLVP